MEGSHQILKYITECTPKTTWELTSMITLILKARCSLFSMQSSTTLLTCLRPLNDPIAATVFPYSFQGRTKSQKWHFKKKKVQGYISKNFYGTKDYQGENLNKYVAASQYL
jgi:hypothetical protein